MVKSNPAYNNSVDRIISKEKEREEKREDPRRELQSSFQLESKSVSSHSMQLQSKYSVSTHNTTSFQPSHAILHTELILPQELQGSSRANQYKASSSDCPRVSKHSTRQNKAPGSPTSAPGPTALQALHTGRLPAILPGRNSILAAASIHTTPTRYPRCIPTEFYQEKQESFQKGQVLYIYAILRSVCSKLLIRIILQEY